MKEILPPVLTATFRGTSGAILEMINESLSFEITGNYFNRLIWFLIAVLIFFPACSHQLTGAFLNYFPDSFLDNTRVLKFFTYSRLTAPQNRF